MFKKLSLLALALGALVAFAIPAVASAEGRIFDTDTGHTAAVNESIPFTGVVEFGGELGGFTGCGIHGNLVVGAGDTATLEDIDITEDDCVGFGFAFSGCTVEEATMGTTDVTVRTHDLVLQNVFIDGTNNSGCFLGLLEDVDLGFDEVVLTPEAESGTSLGNMTVSGEGTAFSAVGETDIEAGGTAGAVDADTWAIETLELE